MGSWTLLTFDVANPHERIERLKSWFLPSDDVAVDRDGLIGFRTDRSYPNYYSLPDDAPPPDDPDDELEKLFGSSKNDLGRGKQRIGSADVVVFGPIMDTVLEPGEFGAVIGASNTSCAASGSVYQKDEGGMVSIVGSVSDEEDGEMGHVMREECDAKFGFKPLVFVDDVTD